MQSVAQGEDWIQNHLQSHQFFKALNTVKNKNLHLFLWVAFERFIYIFFYSRNYRIAYRYWILPCVFHDASGQSRKLA